MGVMVQERYGDEGVPQAYYRNQTVPLESGVKKVALGRSLRGMKLYSRKTV